MSTGAKWVLGVLGALVFVFVVGAIASPEPRVAKQDIKLPSKKLRVTAENFGVALRDDLVGTRAKIGTKRIDISGNFVARHPDFEGAPVLELGGRNLPTTVRVNLMVTERDKAAALTEEDNVVAFCANGFAQRSETPLLTGCALLVYGA